ncbi:Cyclic pyranopterin monophosphate synthase accessory protein [Planctomycetes bacterium CA13]|uniref:cyclic pyranopterin monophosphate synthase n=2 Tax=Novipirellula herctigrandis TaxID=2527986 RepID=A0A5C5YY86_9BACT|nr:Cyclic pyranopterin monophosphate synthase accessory protein [Planctomycetes bacterium CA13]
MVDVSEKPVSVRQASASAQIVMASATAEVIRGCTANKGDVLGIARLAGIQATKFTSLLIPLCHSIPIESVMVDFQWADDNKTKSVAKTESQETLCCIVTVRTSAKTGVEMEAMTAASIASLTVYDMVKSIDRSIAIGPIVLEQKSGGKSGDYHRA